MRPGFNSWLGIWSSGAIHEKGLTSPIWATLCPWVGMLSHWPSLPTSTDLIRGTLKNPQHFLKRIGESPRCYIRCTNNSDSSRWRATLLKYCCVYSVIIIIIIIIIIVNIIQLSTFKPCNKKLNFKHSTHLDECQKCSLQQTFCITQLSMLLLWNTQKLSCQNL